MSETEHHPLLLDLYFKIFTFKHDSVIVDALLIFFTLVLYIPSTLVFSGKFFEHCIAQRDRVHYLKQSWITQFFICVFQNTTGSSISYLMSGATPPILEQASFLLPLMFFIWYQKFYNTIY